MREVRAPASHEGERELVEDKKGIDDRERHHERSLSMMKQTQRSPEVVSRDVVSKSRTENRGGGERIKCALGQETDRLAYDMSWILEA